MTFLLRARAKRPAAIAIASADSSLCQDEGLCQLVTGEPVKEISRAMDNLNVFVMEEAKERVLPELVGALNGTGAAPGEGIRV
jgi:hypothetical protein